MRILWTQSKQKQCAERVEVKPGLVCENKMARILKPSPTCTAPQRARSMSALRVPFHVAPKTSNTIAHHAAAAMFYLSPRSRAELSRQSMRRLGRCPVGRDK